MGTLINNTGSQTLAAQADRTHAMQDNVKTAAPAHKSVEPPMFQKRYGSTVYRVSVHFSQMSKETIEDKLLRLMKSEVRDSA